MHYANLVIEHYYPLRQSVQHRILFFLAFVLLARPLFHQVLLHVEDATVQMDPARI
jgi:hypothetical protein